MRLLFTLVTFATALPLAAESPASALGASIRAAGLDAEQCYRVRDLRFARDEIRMYFTDGYLIFAKPVNGTRLAAVFTADVEAGDGELLIMPPFLRERKSLAGFTGSPTLNEHFTQAIVLFTDGAAEELLRDIEEHGARRSPERGALLAQSWNPVLSSFVGSFEVRLVEDLLSPNRLEAGFVFAAFTCNHLGNFDLIFDPRSRHQISIGQVAFRNDRRYFDVWSNFEGRSFRAGERKYVPDGYRIEKVIIDATIQPDLTMKAVSRLRIVPERTERAIGLELSQQMRITEVKVDGQPADAFYPESLRANLIRSADNQLVLITGPAEFTAGKPVEIEFHHEGNVISETGEKVYFVGARGVWYPNRNLQFSNFDVTFRFPKDLGLVATGTLVEERTEGEWKIQRRRTPQPVRLFGFNLGDFEHTRMKRGDLTVEVYANRKLETALQPRATTMIVTPGPAPANPFPRDRRQPNVITIPPSVPDPTARIRELASEIATAFEDMTAWFGPPPLMTLAASPIPGRFGQGFPGLLYLSTLSYLSPADRGLPQGSTMMQVFFSEILHTHEVAHQWWGNGVTSADYQDDWLMEALANYSALWLIEKHKGTRVLDQILDRYREDLLLTNKEGKTVESAGPPTLGRRLNSSLFPNAWAMITYEKGSWILHMLRRRMGDEAFQKMLAAVYQRYLFKPVTTSQFQEAAAEFLPQGMPDPKLENFFDQWVHSTGIPAVRLTTKVSGRAPKVTLTATLTQSDVENQFSVWVPVEIETAHGKPVIEWMQTAAEPVSTQVALKAPPVRVTLDPGRATLTRP